MKQWPPSLSGRRLLLFGGLLLFCYCFVHLGPGAELHAGSNPFSTIGRFLSAAFSPALSDQSQSLPPGATPFLERLGNDLLRTLRYALIAMSMALPLGLGLGLLASSAWWPLGISYGRPSLIKRGLRLLLQTLRWSCRLLIAFLRSVHELIWAMFLLSALGDAPLAACVALALPFAGTLAKVFSELIDEENRSARTALLSAGASPLQTFLGVLLPQSLPGLLTYTLYRFECALRSSAVLGFIGIETLGLGIRRSFENLYFEEVWTQLYALIAVIVLTDRLGAMLRRRLNLGPARKQNPAAATEAEVRRTAPRDWLLRGAGLATLILILLSWNLGKPVSSDLSGPQQRDRVARFLTKITPEPAKPSTRLAGWPERREAWSSNHSETRSWAATLWRKNGAEALGNTVAIATVAVILAGLGASLLLPFASRALATPEPFGLLGSPSIWKNRLLKVGGSTVRGIFVVTRAIPEYIYAFLLVALLGPSAWPLVIALAIHNVGILGRLWGEIMENERPEAPRQLARVGARRTQIYLGSLIPLGFNRFLLFFFYRWETCVREATVLGMLGITSLGYYISISRDFLRYDQMLFYVLLGAAVILLGDILSDILRKRFRVSR